MPAQHDDPNTRVLPQAGEGLGQLSDHAVVEGITDLRPVEEDLGDTAFDVDVQGVHADRPAFADVPSLHVTSATCGPLRSCQARERLAFARHK